MANQYDNQVGISNFVIEKIKYRSDRFFWIMKRLILHRVRHQFSGRSARTMTNAQSEQRCHRILSRWDVKQNCRRQRICEGRSREVGRTSTRSVRLWRSSKSKNKGQEHNYLNESRSSKAARKRQIKGKDGIAREKGEERGKGVRWSGVYSSARLESEMFGGRVIFLRRFSTAPLADSTIS